METCQNCGKPLREGVKFCPACGEPVPPPQPTAEEYVAEAAAAIDDALEQKMAGQPWNTGPSLPLGQREGEELESVEAEIVEEGALPGGPNRPVAPGLSSFQEVEPRRTPGERPRRRKSPPLELTPQARKALIAVLIALAVVLVVLVAALLMNGDEEPAEPVSASSSEPAPSEPETPPAADIPGPGEPSSLKTVAAEAIEPQFLEADQFQDNGMARVRTESGWEVIDQYGKFITGEAYDEVGYFNDGYCWVKKNGKYAFMAEDGSILGGSWYRTLLPFSEGLALVETATGRYVYIDIQGDVAVNPVEDYKSLGSFSGGLARVVTLGGKVTYINTDGKEAAVAGGGFAAGGAFDPETGLCPVTNKDSDGWFYISSDGEPDPSLTGFDAATNFQDGVALVTREGKMAHIRSDGSLITKFEYDEVWRYSDGYATVRIGDRYGYVDTQGQLVIPVTLEDVWSFGNGLVPVKLTDDWGYLGANGEIAIKAQWEECYKFYDGVAKYREEGRFGYLNTQGEILCAPQYKNGGYSSFGMIPVQKDDGLWGYLAVS